MKTGQRLEEARAWRTSTVNAGIRARRVAGVTAVAAIPVLFIGVFFLYPVASILWRGLVADGRFDAGPLMRVLTDSDLREIAWFTLWQAAVSTLATVVIAMPGAYVLSHYRFRGRALLRAAVTIPLILPTVVVAVAFLALAGPKGSLGIDLKGTIWIILIAHVFYNYAVVVRTVGGLWGHLDPRLEEAARILGATRVQAFTRVTLPLLRPAIGAAASIVFLFSFTSFGVILILGGPRRVSLEVEIYRQTAELLNLPVAASLAIVQLVGVFLVLTWYSRYQNKRAVQLNLRPATEVERTPTTLGQKTMLRANVALMAGLLFVPLGVLVKRSLTTESGLGLLHYTLLNDRGASSILAVAPTEALRNSLTFAVIAMVIALVVGGLAASLVGYRKSRATQWFDALLMLPLGTSAVTVGFGFLISLDTGILDLRSKPIIIPLAHALVAVPFVVRVMVPIIQSIDRRLREVAAVLGASPVRVWREIDLPIVAKASLVGAGFAAAVSLGEFGATAFIVRPNLPTLPVAIFRLMSRPGSVNFGMAMAMSVILMLVTGAVMLSVERFRAGDVGTF